MKYLIALGLSLSLISAVTLGAFADEPTETQSLAEFKGMCLRNKDTLKYEDNNWYCVSTKESEEGLTSIPVKFLKKDKS